MSNGRIDYRNRQLIWIIKDNGCMVMSWSILDMNTNRCNSQKYTPYITGQDAERGLVPLGEEDEKDETNYK